MGGLTDVEWSRLSGQTAHPSLSTSSALFLGVGLPVFCGGLG